MNRYDELGSPLVYLYAELEADLINNIARYINELDYEKTGFAFRQLKKLGLLNKENTRLIAKAAKKSLPEIKRIVNDAGVGGMQETNRLYKEAMETGQLPLEPVPLDLSPEVRSILDRSLANAKSMFNLTNTQAVTSCQRAFMDASNKAYLEVANGLKTKEEATKDAVLSLAKDGIRVGNYVRTNPETGEQETYYRNRMDTIIRRNIQTTIAQTEAASVIARCKAFGVNTVAVSGHFGARVSDTDPVANHYGWQLKVYSIDGETDEYPNLEKCTGYPSNPLGLCGYSCRHRIYIFIPGVSKLPRENYDEAENRKYYELTQKQRAIECNIRTLKRQISAGNTVGADTTALTAKLGAKQAKMRQFVKDNGLTRSREREQENTGINNRSVSAKATWAHRKSEQGIVANNAEGGIIKSLDVEDFELAASYADISQEVSGVISGTIKEYESNGGMYISDVHFGDFYDEATGKPALFQIFPNAYGMIEMNINSRLLGGKTVDEIDQMIAKTIINLPQNLREAVIHECGHAKAYYRKTVKEIQEMNRAILNKGVEGISLIAEHDGAECIAEVEVLLARGEKVPKAAMDLYKEHVKGEQN